MLLLSAGLPARSQDTVFYGSFSGKFRTGYEPGGSSRYRNGNEMIYALAEDLIKPPAWLHIDLEFRITLSLVQHSPGLSSLLLTISEPLVTGDVRYRKFDVSPVMAPDLLMARIWVIHRNDSIPLQETDMPVKSWKEGNGLIEAGEIRNFNPARDTLVVHEASFYYSDKALAAFRERIRLVDDYFAAVFVADTLLRMGADVDFRDRSRYPVSFVFLEETGKMSGLLERKDFDNNLGLERYDPGGLAGKYDRLFKLFRSDRMTFNETLDKSDTIRTVIPVDSAVNTFLSGILRYIRWSLIVNDRGSRIYKEYLDNYFTEKIFPDDLAVLKKLLSLINPGKDPEMLMNELSVRIKGVYEKEAQRLLDRGHHAMAAELLENARRFIENDPYLKHDAADPVLKAKAAQGIYGSYLGVAGMCISNARYRMAMDYLLKAHRYRAEHAGFIPSDTLSATLLQQLFSRDVVFCDTLAARHEFSDAIECYTMYENRLDTAFIPLLHDEISLRKDMAMKGLLADSAGREIYLTGILKQVTGGEYLIWTGRLGDAEQFADSMAAVSRTFGYAGHPRFETALDIYRKKITGMRCHIASEDADVLCLRAQRDIELGFFAKAGILLDSAILIGKKDPACGIDVPRITDTLWKYAAPIRFQQMAGEFGDDLVLNAYPQAVKCYIRCEDFFTENRLGRFGLACRSLYEVSKEKDMLLLTLAAAAWYDSTGNARECFRYARLLHEQGGSNKMIRDLLPRLGRELAAEDMAIHPATEMQTLLAGYTGGNRWYSAFSRAYVSEWRKKP
jgi:hypothetical protein